MSETIDRKFRILAVNPCEKDSIYTEQQGMFFCAKDAALPNTLRAYYDECEKLGCKYEHLESIQLLLERVERYQLKVIKKIPDTETNCEIDRCIGGILQGEGEDE